MYKMKRKPKIPKAHKRKQRNAAQMVNGMCTGFVHSLFAYTGYTALGKLRSGYLNEKKDEYGGKPPISAGKGGKYYRQHSRNYI